MSQAPPAPTARARRQRCSRRPGSSAPPAAAIATPATAAPADPTTVTTAAPVTPRPPAPTTPPKTNPPGPVSGTRVTALPSTGKVGSSFLFQFAGFRPGGVNVTVTDPNGTTKGFGSSAGLDGSGSFTFTTKVGRPGGSLLVPHRGRRLLGHDDDPGHRAVAEARVGRDLNARRRTNSSRSRFLDAADSTKHRAMLPPSQQATERAWPASTSATSTPPMS